MTMELRPLDHHILIRRESEETATASGIVLTTAHENEWTSRGVVLAVGSGRRDTTGKNRGRNPVDAKVGQTVLYPRGEEVQRAGGDDYILPETHILATIDEDGTVTPYWDKVLVELDVEDTVRDSGVILPGSTIEKGYDFGRVVAVGPGFPTNGTRHEVDVAVGDKVVFSQFNAMELDLGVEDNRRIFITRVSQDGIKATISE